MNGAARSPCDAVAQPPPPLSLIMDGDGFEAWLRAGHRGSRITYYRGHLIADRAQKPLAPHDETRAELSRLAGRAMRAAEQGLVHLLQKRHGEADYSYLAIRTRTRPSRNPGARS